MTKKELIENLEEREKMWQKLHDELDIVEDQCLRHMYHAWATECRLIREMIESELQ